MTNSKPQCTLLSESCSLNVWVHFIQISHTHSYEYLPPGERIEISVLVCQLKRLCQFQWKWSLKSKPWYTFLSESYSLNSWVHLIQTLHTHSYGYSPPGERIEISVLVCQLKRLCQFQWKWSLKSKPWYTFLSECYSLNAWVHLIQTLHTHSYGYLPPGERI